MTVVQYTWNPLTDGVLEELDGGGTNIALITSAPNPFGPILFQNRAGVGLWHHFDASGSTRLLTTSLETVENEYLFDAWGVSVHSPIGTNQPYQWNGRWGYQYEPLRAQYYIRERIFDPLIARWLSLDTLRDDINNRFLYGCSSPTLYIDPSGLVEVKLIPDQKPEIPDSMPWTSKESDQPGEVGWTAALPVISSNIGKDADDKTKCNCNFSISLKCTIYIDEPEIATLKTNNPDKYKKLTKAAVYAHEQLHVINVIIIVRKAAKKLEESSIVPCDTSEKACQDIEAAIADKMLAAIRDDAEHKGIDPRSPGKEQYKNLKVKGTMPKEPSN